MKITIITKDDLRITYKGDVNYSFKHDIIEINYNIIEIHHTSGEYLDSYKFKDLKGIIINTKRAKDADKR